jgi:hypothetical protein
VKIYNLLTFVFQAPCLFHGLFTHCLVLFDGHEDSAVKMLAPVCSLADLESKLFSTDLRVKTSCVKLLFWTLSIV